MGKKVAVVGAGLGGISSAISLAQAGYAVEVYEKNAQIGGKLNVLTSEGYTFDLGPSILTLPHYFERLFELSGKRMSDYFTIFPVRPHWRNFFEDGTVIDLVPEWEAMAAEARKAGEDPEAVRAFLDYASRLYDLVEEGYFAEGLDTVGEVFRHYGLVKSIRLDPLRTMHGGVARFLKTDHFRHIFDFFIKYVGSSAHAAPAVMNCLPTIQFRHDLWYVEGGLYNIARGLGRLMKELNISVHLDSEVTSIEKARSRVTGLVVKGKGSIAADIVVSNNEVIPTYRDLLGEDDTFLRTLRRFEPSCSGLVLELGLDRTYPQLAHHNFFFSRNPRGHFDSVHRKKVLPEDPTIYLVAASKTDPTVAPQGCDCLKILPHIPHLVPERPLAPEDYQQFRDLVVHKLERMGLEGLSGHIVCEHMWTPVDIQRQYHSNRGSIYGVVCDRMKNFALKAPKQSNRYRNLFFAGGSVNPGGGMPMVILSGQNTCQRIVEWDRSRS